MDYFNDVLTNFLGLECGSCAAVYAGTEISRMLSKNMNLCSEDEQRYNMRESNDIIFIFGGNILLI